MRCSDGRLSISKKERGKVFKEHIEIIKNENEWDHNIEADLVEGPGEKVRWEEVMKAIREMKVGKAAGPSEVMESGEIGIGAMVELCQDELDGRGMQDEWEMSVVVQDFQEERGCNELWGV